MNHATRPQHLAASCVEHNTPLILYSGNEFLSRAVKRIKNGDISNAEFIEPEDVPNRLMGTNGLMFFTMVTLPTGYEFDQPGRTYLVAKFIAPALMNYLFRLN